MSVMVRLDDEELMLLDGRCGEEPQREVDRAKLRIAMRAKYPSLPPAIAGLVGDVVSHAQENGRLAFLGRHTRWCALCGKSPEPLRYRSGRRRGQIKDHGRLFGREFRDAFVRVENHISLGGCAECIEAARPALVAELESVRAEIPQALTGHAPRWTRWPRRHCTKCEWEGHEGQMGLLSTVMGDGRYRGSCPSCGAQNTLFNTVVELRDGHEVVESTAVNG